MNTEGMREGSVVGREPDSDRMAEPAGQEPGPKDAPNNRSTPEAAPTGEALTDEQKARLVVEAIRPMLLEAVGTGHWGNGWPGYWPLARAAVAALATHPSAPVAPKFEADRETVQRCIDRAKQWLVDGATGEPPRIEVALLWTLAQATLDLPENAAPADDESVAYPRDFFSRLIHENSPYAFYIFQWVPYQTDAKRWRLKMQHDVRTFDGREALNIWPNGSHCGPFRDDEVEFIRISRSQFGDAWKDPRPDRAATPSAEAQPTPKEN